MGTVEATTYKNCQSCGMPLKRDARGGGTNADGSRSTMCCSRCYAYGRFAFPDMTVDQMQELVRGKLRELGFPGPLGWLFTRRIPKLKRWNSAGRR